MKTRSTPQQSRDRKEAVHTIADTGLGFVCRGVTHCVINVLLPKMGSFGISAKRTRRLPDLASFRQSG
jgi:hypothetical protein